MLETRFLQGTRSNLSLRLEVRAVVPMLSSMIPGEIVEYLDTGKVLAAFRVRARELTQKRRASPDVLRDLCGT